MSSLPSGFNGPITWVPTVIQDGANVAFDAAWSAQIINGWCHCVFTGVALAPGAANDLFVVVPLSPAASVTSCGSFTLDPDAGGPVTGVAEVYNHDDVSGEVYFRLGDGSYIDTAIAVDDQLTFHVTYPVGDGVAFSGSTPGAVSITFEYNGSNGNDGTPQEWEVPSGVTEITIDAYGAQGGGGAGADGGLGGRIISTHTVTPGETLEVRVGGCPQGRQDSGYNNVNGSQVGLGGSSSTDGWGGGGPSDVRRTPFAIADRLMSAGGGGGAGGKNGGDIYAGGDAGDPGSAGASGVHGGEGATDSAGGAASTDTSICATWAPATAGIAGAGGKGLDESGCIGEGGGGGGGGWFGGGGGGNDGTASAGGGGGGGSCGAEVGASIDSTDDGVRSSHGVVTISWTNP